MAIDNSYWEKSAYDRRQAEKRAKRPDTVEQWNTNPFDAIGGFLGQAGKNIGDFFADADRNAGDATRERLAAKGYTRNNSGQQMGQQRAMPQQSIGQRDSSRDNNDLFSHLMSNKVPEGIRRRDDDEMEDEESATDRILARLGERFSYDESSDEGTKENMTALDQLLQGRLGELNGIRDQTNSNFAKSDGNVAAMHAAFQKEVRGQAPGIQQRGDETQANIRGIFDKTINDNNAQAETERATKLEMLQRLGIAPAANAPDKVQAAIATGNNTAQQGRDSRLAASVGNTQTALTRNEGLANAIGNDGLQRRSGLNMRLQEVLGQLSGKEADYRSDFQKSKMDIQNQGEDRAYERWLQDRQFDQGLFNDINQDNQAMAEIQGKNAAEAAKLGAKTNSSSDINGLMASANPKLRQAMVNASTKFDIANEPQKVMQWISQNNKDLNADEVFQFVTNYARVKGGKYADPNG